jgi:hypothetical protein
VAHQSDTRANNKAISVGRGSKCYNSKMPNGDEEYVAVIDRTKKFLTPDGYNRTKPREWDLSRMLFSDANATGKSRLRSGHNAFSLLSQRQGYWSF